MFKVWIMHDVWFLNRRRVLKTPHPIFILFYFSFKGNLAFCLYKFESPLKGCYKPSHLSLLFRWAKKVRSHNVYICFFNFLVLYDCIRTFQAVCCTWFCLGIMTIKRSTGMSFYIGGGKWRSFPKAFQNYTLRGFFLIRTRFAHFIHNCHDILRQFMIENMQL